MSVMFSWASHICGNTMLSMSLDLVVSLLLLGGHLYRIPEVVPTTAPPKQCCKVVSHTRKFIFSTICSKGEQKDTVATTASAKAPSTQQKQVDKVAAKHEDSLCTQSSKIARLVKKVQTFQPQVRDRFPQAKQRDFSSKTSSSPRCRFNKCFYLSPENSTQWRPLLPKEGGLIQVDIGGHPPFPNGSKQFSGHFGNLLFLAGFHLRDHFEGLNEVFSISRFSMISEGMIEPPKWISSMIPFQRVITRLKQRSYAKVTTPGSWCTNLPKRGPHDFWHFIS